jgi:dienelactone hydrolase
VAVYFGGKDAYAPVGYVDALRREPTDAEAACHITTFSEAEDAFTDPDAAAFHMPGSQSHCHRRSGDFGRHDGAPATNSAL